MIHPRHVGLGDHRGKHRVVAPVEFDLRNRKASRRPFPGHAVEPAQRIDVADVQVMQVRVEHVDLREIHADAERQDCDCGQREPGRAAHRSRGVSHILPQVIEPRPAPLVACLFLQSQRAAEVAPPVGGHHLAMRGHLFLQLPLQPAAMDQCGEATHEFAHIRQSSGWLVWPRWPVRNPQSRV